MLHSIRPFDHLPFTVFLGLYFLDFLHETAQGFCMGRRKGSVNKVDVANLPRGVTYLRDGRARPWMVRHRSLPAETFATPEGAVARKMELIALERTQGIEALTYSREIHADVISAREVLPEGVSHLRAAEFWRAHHAAVELPLAQAVNQFVDLRRSQSIRPGGWTRHTKDLKSRLGRFALAFAERPMPDITGESILQWLAGLTDDHTGAALSARSVANYRSALENFFNFAARRKWVAASPMTGVIQEDLPTVRRSKKHPLTVCQARQLLEVIAREAPRYLMHFALRLYLGIRTEESQRFRWEWIQREQGRIIMPGWFLREDGATIDQGSKTGDDWSISDVAPAFWGIYDATPRPTSGDVPAPANNIWHGYARPQGNRQPIPSLKRLVMHEIGLETWPHNATRDTFCTLHISAYGSPERTALVLKHRNSQTLWQSYLGQLVPEAEAVAFFED